MSLFPNLTEAMESFEQAFAAGLLNLKRGQRSTDLQVHMDRLPGDEVRLTFAKLQAGTVTAYVVFIPAERLEGLRCLSIGWAVPERYQREGRGAEAVKDAIAELQHMLGGAPFYVEAVVAADNLASQRLAEKVISTTGKKGVDGEAGIPIVQYLRKVEALPPNGGAEAR